METRWLLAALLVVSAANLAVAAPPIRAFPTAEGFGANAVGGRDGRVIEMTNLDDAGPGSLRAALEASGPRIVVFRVSSTITLKNAIQVRTGAKKASAAVKGGEKRTFSCPDTRDWVLHLNR